MQLKSLEKKGAVPNDKLIDFWKEYEDFINSEKIQGIKLRMESGFQGFDAEGSSAPPRGTTEAGRCNLEGVSYLYAALEEHTAIAEIRPFIKVNNLGAVGSSVVSVCLVQNKIASKH